MKMKCLVTGANGFLGGWLTKRLVDHGHDVHVLVRRPLSGADLPTNKLKQVIGDITHRESVFAACEDMEGVFHLAGLVAYTPGEREAMMRVNFQGTINVVDACLKAQVHRLLHVSSVVAIGASFDPNIILNEQSEFNVQHLHLGYFDSKLLAEKYVLEKVQTSGLNAVVVNPSTIYGAGDAKKGSRGTQLKVARGKFPFYTSGGANIVAVEDVVEGILLAYSKGKTGDRYILSGENIRIKDLFKKIADLAGVKPPAIYMPNPLLMVLGKIGDQLLKMGQRAPINSEAAWVARLYHWFSNEKAKRELGFNARSADIALENSIRWCKENKLI